MGSLLLTAGAPGCRTALPNARIMIHQPSGGAQVWGVGRGRGPGAGRVGAGRAGLSLFRCGGAIGGLGLGQRHCDPGQGDSALAGAPQRAVRQAHQAAAERDRYGAALTHPLASWWSGCALTCARAMGAGGG